MDLSELERPRALNSKVAEPFQIVENFRFLYDNELLVGQVASTGSPRLRSQRHKGLSDPSVSVPFPFGAGSVSS